MKNNPSFAGLLNFFILVNIVIYLLWMGIMFSFEEHTTLKIALFAFNFIFSLLLGYQVKLRWPKASPSTKARLSIFFNIALTLAIAGVVSFLVFKNNHTFDATKQKINTLSEQSIALAKKIETPMEFIVIAPREEWRTHEQITKLYQNLSNHIHVKFFDPDESPEMLNLYQVDRVPALVIVSGKLMKVTNDISEQGVSTRLIQLDESKLVKICNVTGHGEISLNDDQQGGSLFLALKRESYEFAQVELEKFDSSCQVLMVLGPSIDLVESEVKVLEQYLKNKTNFFLAIDPKLDGSSIGNWNKFFNEMQIIFGNNLVLDRLSDLNGVEASVQVFKNLSGESELAKAQLFRLVLPASQSVTGIEGDEQLALTQIFPATWGEKNFEELKTGRAAYEENDDKGPLNLILAGQRNKSKFIATGTSKAFDTSGLKHQGNLNFLLNSFAWLSNQPFLISVNRPEIVAEKVIISKDQNRLIFYTSMVFLPLLFFILALWAFLRLKKK